jgi:2'-5' RNA ligase
MFVGVPVPALDFAGTGIARAEAHLTVAFVGDVDPGREAALVAALEGALVGIAAFPLEFRGVGAFPSSAAPRVVWIGTADGSRPMIDLARRVHDRLREANFPAEDRPLVPHVTLFRVRSAADASRARRVLAEASDRRFGATVVRSVTLWESQLRPTGAIHLARRTWTLAEPHP